jgi:hypothetical protein
MKFLTILAALSTTIGTTLAADICRPTGTDCFGSAVCCLGIQEGSCCNLGAASTRIRMVVPANRYVHLYSPYIHIQGKVLKH